MGLGLPGRSVAMEIEVKEIAPGPAASAMNAAGLRAALDCDTAEQIAAGGQCFSMQTPQGACVAVLRVKGSVLWIDGAGATQPGRGITEAGLELAEQIARRAGCNQVAFETVRPGLVRKSKQQGFAVAGYIMRKELQ